MTGESNAKTFSFADLVRQYRVEVPIIQRDYAQGRSTPKVKSIRERFVADLLKVLKSRHGQGKLDLAFVYGHVRNGIFVPVDGQQRLTTLFLLHLYFVKRCMLESTCGLCKYADLLKRFTYATRQTSREFCEAISSCNRQILPSDISKYSGEDVKFYIREQPWFFVEWCNDPTVVGMLEVLQTIHEAFTTFEERSDTTASLQDILALLFGDNCPVSFHFLDMGLNGLSDDLYLKMNARGLPLDDIERFKSDYEDYMKEEKWNNVNFGDIEPKSKYYKIAKTYKKGSWKFDLIWGDEFWQRYHEESQTRMMSVVARCFSVAARTIRNFDKEMEELLSEIAEGEIEYVSFDAFGAILKGLGMRMVEQLSLFLDNIVRLRERNISIAPSWPHDNQMDILVPANMKERIVFAMLSSFPTDVEKEEDELDKWLRIVWNIVENSNVDNSNLGSYIRLFNSWFDKKRDILEVLSGLDYKEDLAKDQILQEVKKARLIMGCNGQEWESLIKRMEKHFLLRGNLCVMMADNPDIDVFRTRVESFEKLFPQSAPDVDRRVSMCCCNMIYEGDGSRSFYSYDCSQPRGAHWRFPVNRKSFKDMLDYNLHDGNGEDAFQKAFCHLLDIGGEVEIDEQSLHAKFTNAGGLLTWQYYFIKYPEVFISDTNGYYHWNGSIEMPQWRMTSDNLRAYNCNPFLLAIASEEDTVWRSSRSGEDGGLHLVDSNISIEMLDDKIGFRVYGVPNIRPNKEFFNCEKNGDGYDLTLKPGKDLIKAGKVLVGELRSRTKNP